MLLLLFISCLGGPTLIIESDCDWADINHSLTVDLLDYSYLQNFWMCALPEGCG